MLRSGEWRAARTALPALPELPARPCAWSQDMASQAQAFCHLCSYRSPVLPEISPSHCNPRGIVPAKVSTAAVQTKYLELTGSAELGHVR